MSLLSKDELKGLDYGGDGVPFAPLAIDASLVAGTLDLGFDGEPVYVHHNPVGGSSGSGLGSMVVFVL